MAVKPENIRTSLNNTQQREYVRAVVAAKLKKMHAKPFVAALEGHTDSVAAMAMSRSKLVSSHPSQRPS